MRSFLIAISRNPLSLIGCALTTASAMLILTLFSIELFGHKGSPYIGILAFLVLPAFFLLGLLLIPMGIALERRRARRAKERGEPARGFPVIDLNLDRVRRIVIAVLLLTVVNMVILATVVYKGVEVMDSTEFCGTTCHSVMHPEYAAYQGSPHARVKCVSCHIGPGADWFVKAKLSGAWQVVSTTFDLYPRPIPSPVHNLRPARETCEQCHWPTKFVGDRLKVITHYASDEANTESKTALLLRVGGIQGRKSHGIHWHVDSQNQIRYRADPTRETIFEIEMRSPDGSVRTFLPPGHDADGAPAAESEWRVMDCIDCHNRPTHIYRLPDKAIDEAMAQQEIDRSLPFVRREGLRALTQDYASHEEARASIRESMTGFYHENYPDADGSAVEQAVDVLGRIYGTNVFPEMSVTWGTYPDHIGHVDSAGCFRCHDDEHATEAGQVVSQDCSTCHTLLAMEEEDAEILRMLKP